VDVDVEHLSHAVLDGGRQSLQCNPRLRHRSYVVLPGRLVACAHDRRRGCRFEAEHRDPPTIVWRFERRPTSPKPKLTLDLTLTLALT